MTNSHADRRFRNVKTFAALVALAFTVTTVFVVSTRLSQEALAVLADECSVRDACAGLSKDDRARARELVAQLQKEGGR